MKKTLGGDRLGSGKKMQVDLHGYSRSTHDMGYTWRSTMSAGTLVPFLCEVALPGDTFDINLGCDIKTHPTIGPLFGSYKVQLDVFLSPIRLYNSHLHNNALNIGRNMSLIKLPGITFTALGIADRTTVEDLDNAQVNPSSIMAYLGVRGFGIAAENHTRTFNAVPLLTYWDIYKNYYANKQEEIGAVIHTPAEPLLENVNTVSINRGGTVDAVPQDAGVTGILVLRFTEITVIAIGPGSNPINNNQIMFWTSAGLLSFADLCSTIIQDGVAPDEWVGTLKDQWSGISVYFWRYITGNDLGVGAPSIATFDLENIDVMRTKILAHTGYDQFNISTMVTQIPPYMWTYQIANDIPTILSSQEGLAIKTYQSDLFNTWIKTEWIDGVDGISAITAVDTSGGSFTIDTLNLSKKVYDFLNRVAVSGGTYDDWQDAAYAHSRYRGAETPMYMGGLIKELVFQEVISQAEATSEGNTQPLGTLAGKGIMAKKHKGGSIVVKVDEPSYIMGIISLTPRIDYSQGNKWDVNLETMDDLHKPALDEIGFQELITDQMAWWDTEYTGGEWVTKSAGKQPAWINYMTNVNQVRGNFAIKNNEMFMTLNRRYEADASGIEDLTTYIDPSKFNFIFANTALDAQNFWAQIGVDMTVRRKMSAKIMPNL